jgi:hypothetical protein
VGFSGDDGDTFEQINSEMNIRWWVELTRGSGREEAAL